MKLGLGLYRHQLNRRSFKFARQCGATHVVAHLVDYFNRGEHSPADSQPTGGTGGWGVAGDPERLWTVGDLRALRNEVNEAGLELEAIENIDPAHWSDVLLDGPRKAEQLEGLKTLIRRIGEAGIPILGYNFSIAGVAGRTTGPLARGGAVSVGMDGIDESPIPQGMVWNMIVNRTAMDAVLPDIDAEELWRRLGDFLNTLLPVAEEAGVRLAAHPDDPPVPRLRGQPRLVNQPHLFQRLLDVNASPSNVLEFCIGTIAEMTEGDVYEAVDRYSSQHRIGYVHLRNVSGKAPRYRETFLDDGDVDIPRVLRILRQNEFDGVVIPDHTPELACDAPWYAGMAYAMGYIRACLDEAEPGPPRP